MTVQPWLRVAAFAEAAAAELASRAKHYPGMILAGEISRDLAAEDLAAWTAIAILFDRGVVEMGLAWSDLIEATARALVTRTAAWEAKRADPYLADRLVYVQILHDQIARSRTFGTAIEPPMVQARRAA
ncbi:hypothetical protein BH09PSE4_BH09PSE4_19440 [soil metagenome]